MATEHDGNAHLKTAGQPPDAEILVDPVQRVGYRLSIEGDILRVEMWANPGGGATIEHIHPGIEERFEVIEGQVTFKVNGQKQSAGPGARLVATAGDRHSFVNTGNDIAHLVAEVQPALNMQALFEDSVTLARAGKFTRRGIPRGLRAALELAEFSDRYSDIFIATFPPPTFQRILGPRLAAVERWRRRRAGT